MGGCGAAAACDCVGCEVVCVCVCVGRGGTEVTATRTSQLCLISLTRGVAEVVVAEGVAEA